MKFLPRSTLKTVISSALAVALLSTAIGGTAMASNHGQQQIYRGDSNNNFGQISNQLRQNLRRSGYYVMDIQADGAQRLNVYAKKNNQPYELKYTYPSLKLISSNKKDWSNVWQDKNNHHQNGNGYNNNQYNNHNGNGYYGQNKQDDVEDRIKKEASYPAIKQRAVRKVSDMGYRVKDIELEEEDNRGVFEIEAKRGSQDYDIVLGYPNLNVIKLEKD
ncbi:PepSY domain-containing protein [Psychrobacter frigidicola]|uniref:PepSY domain-containing protein n=1 Tax=Psychrobacter frigidicola TaxID=45611 RepID=UPI0019193AA4|nr:PepSY domain-containing protein [Psychrobacter frigidicola]